MKMKKLAIVLLLSVFTFNVSAQDGTMKEVVKTVSLEQTEGEFTQKSLTLSEGVYVFEIANANVDHEVGFVLAPKGKTDQANHIKA